MEKTYTEEEVTRIIKTQADQFAWFGREIEKLLDSSLKRIQENETNILGQSQIEAGE